MNGTLTGASPYVTGVGLIGYAIYQFSTGECGAAVTNLLAGLGLLGLKLHFFDKPKEEPKP